MNINAYDNNHGGDRQTERAFNIAVIMVAILAISMVAVNGQELARGDLIGHPTSCQHVINLVHRHGVNQSFDRVGSAQHLQHSPFGSMMIPATEMGDLEIVSVHQIAHDSSTNVSTCGPKIAVVIANQSHRCVESFSVTAVATLGRMHFDSPNKTVKVNEIKAGEALQVELDLPIEALAMGNRGGQLIGFQRLVIAIDSFDELAETDEANNIKAYAIASVPTIATTVVENTVVSEVGVEVTSSESLPTDPQVSGTGHSASPTAVGSPVTQGTSTASSDPLQTAIDQLETVAATSES